jgi:hypothetical protein
VYNASGDHRFNPHPLGHIIQEGLSNMRAYAPPVSVNGLSNDREGGKGRTEGRTDGRIDGREQQAANRTWLYATMAATQLTLFDVTDPDPTKARMLASTALVLPSRFSEWNSSTTIASTSTNTTTTKPGLKPDGIFAFGVGVVEAAGLNAAANAHYIYVAFSSKSGGMIGILPYRYDGQQTPQVQRYGSGVGGGGDGDAKGGIRADSARTHHSTGMFVPLMAVIASSTEKDAQAAYVTVDRARGRLYAAYSCAGVALFDITDPAAPKLEV